MEQYDNREGEKGVKATTEQVGTADKDDDGVVGDRNNGGDQEDHEIAEDSETGTELEDVAIHPERKKCSAANTDLNLGNNYWASASSRE